MDWGKFVTTEWLAFLAIFGTASYALFTRFMTGSEWGIAVIGAATQLVVTRWHKKKTIIENHLVPPEEQP